MPYIQAEIDSAMAEQKQETSGGLHRECEDYGFGNYVQ